MPAATKRGAFIVLEGLDRSGKSTQVARLVDALTKDGVKAVACRFPDRTTTIGTMIHSYLTQTSELDDRAIHLLFSANRWERAQSILADLKAGTTVICDRYAFSGIAFSVAKVPSLARSLPSSPLSQSLLALPFQGLSYKWCQSPDVGLPCPDLVLFLDLSPEVAAARGGYGEERYETSAVQLAVREIFKKIGEDVGKETWNVVDAGLGIDEVQRVVREKVDACRATVGEEVRGLWMDGKGE